MLLPPFDAAFFDWLFDRIIGVVDDVVRLGDIVLQFDVEVDEAAADAALDAARPPLVGEAADVRTRGGVNASSIISSFCSLVSVNSLKRLRDEVVDDLLFVLVAVADFRPLFTTG